LAALVTVVGGYFVANSLASKFECKIAKERFSAAQTSIYQLKDNIIKLKGLDAASVTKAVDKILESNTGSFDEAVGPFNRMKDACLKEDSN
jgi:hypothetical protein